MEYPHQLSQSDLEITQTPLPVGVHAADSRIGGVSPEPGESAFQEELPRYDHLPKTTSNGESVSERIRLWVSMCAYISMPSSHFASSPITKEIAATLRLIAPISAKRGQTGIVCTTEM